MGLLLLVAACCPEILPRGPSDGDTDSQCALLWLRVAWLSAWRSHRPWGVVRRAPGRLPASRWPVRPVGQGRARWREQQAPWARQVWPQLPARAARVAEPGWPAAATPERRAPATRPPASSRRTTHAA